MKRYSTVIKYAILILSVVLISFVSGLTTLYGDDYIYGTYFLQGIKNFLSLTYKHYMMMNGRTFVHFVLELILIFKDKLFFIIIPLMIFLSSLIFIKCVDINILKNKKAYYFSFVFMGIMCMPILVLREGMLWMAGAMNYIFPLIFSLLALYITKRAAKGENLKKIYFAIMFLCGATTEQCGMIAISSSVLYIVFYCINNKKYDKKLLCMPIFSVMGYLTVILSPGTSSRISEETAEHTDGIVNSLYELYEFVLSDIRMFFILIVTLILIGCMIDSNNKYKTPLLLSVLLSIAFALFEKWLICGIIITIAFISISFAMLLKNERKECAILILTGLLSMAMMIFSTSYGYRNFMPCMLIMIFVSSYSLCVISDKYNDTVKTSFIAVVFILSFIMFFPTLKGYMHNREIINGNIDNFKNYHIGDEGVIYNTDIDKLYSYNQFYVDSFYYEGIKKIYKLSEDAKIFIKGKDFDDLYINGIHCENPIYLNDYYPLRNTIEAFGGTVIWDETEKECKIELEYNKYIYDKKDKKIYFDDDTKRSVDEYILVDHTYGNMFNSNIYVHKNMFFEVFGVTLQ